MKFRLDYFRLQHAHIFPNICIDRRAQLFRRDLALNLDIRHLPFSMYTRIGPTRTMNTDTSPFNQRERTRQLALHRSQIFLNLPSVKISAVVLEKQLVIHFGFDNPASPRVLEVAHHKPPPQPTQL